MRMKDAFLFGEGKRGSAFGCSPLDSRYESAVYWNNGSRVSKQSERVFCVPLSCGLVSQIATQTAFRGHRNPLKADHLPGLRRAPSTDRRARGDARSCAPLGQCGPPVWDPSAGETHQRSFLSILAPGVPGTQAQIAHVVDAFLFCQHNRWCSLERHQAVY